jgi:hypothetical protein
MPKIETLSYEEQYKDVTVSFSPYVQNSMGILQSQTSLKVDTYTLACVPYQLSMARTVLIGAFSKDEIVFFQRFKGSLAGLTLSFQRPTAKAPVKIFCRCQVSAVGQMKGRDGVGLIICDFKPIPPDLAEILGDHLMSLERLRMQWDDLRDKAIQINPENSRKLGYNNFAVMTVAGVQRKLALYSLAVNRLDFLMPLRSEDLQTGEKASFSLYFQRYRFNVEGSVESSQRLPSGVQKARASVAFSPELCELASDYYFALSHPPAKA